MEGWMIAEAVVESASVKEFIVVKAICDWGTEDKNDSWQVFAASAAANLVQYVVSQPGALNGLVNLTSTKV